LDEHCSTDGEDQARALTLPLEWPLPLSRLTAFVAVRLSVDAAVDDTRLVLVLKLPAEGMPEGRTAQVLRTLISSRNRFSGSVHAALSGSHNLKPPALPGDIYSLDE
jgi:hypothetical protein